VWIFDDLRALCIKADDTFVFFDLVTTNIEIGSYINHYSLPRINHFPSSIQLKVPSTFRIL